jgi:hypothetical protein
MNTPYFGENSHSTEIVERVDAAAAHPGLNSDAYTGNVPDGANKVYEVPMGGTMVSTDPMDGQPIDEISMQGTGPEVNITDGTVVREVPVQETHNNGSMVETSPDRAVAGTKDESPVALLDRAESEHFRTRWNEIQGTFVDEPRAAVQQADALVTDVIAQITQMFASNHSTLESQWKQGNDVSTEDLRKALQHYRSFFNRLMI